MTTDTAKPTTADWIARAAAVQPRTELFIDGGRPILALARPRLPSVAGRRAEAYTRRSQSLRAESATVPRGWWT